LTPPITRARLHSLPTGRKSARLRVINDPDQPIRLAALGYVAALARRYDDLVPRSALLEGFSFNGARWSLGSLQNGIYRPARFRGPAALTLLTAAHKPGQPAPYDDDIDVGGGTILYHYRAGSIDQADNRALRAAFAEQVPLIYFMGVAPSQLVVAAPVCVTADDPGARAVTLTVGVSIADTTPAGLVSPPDARVYAVREVRTRLHQQRFRINVLHAYRERCAICALQQRELVQAAHIVEDNDPAGIAAVINGLALCSIHHLAYDRNLLGIDPDGVVHIAARVLDEIDGPMLREGLQGFHGRPIGLPRRCDDRPDAPGTPLRALHQCGGVRCPIVQLLRPRPNGRIELIHDRRADPATLC
jgi:putative restriction endonuclease